MSEKGEKKFNKKIFLTAILLCFAIAALCAGIMTILHFEDISSSPTDTETSAYTTTYIKINMYTQTGTSAYSSGNKDWVLSDDGGTATIEFYYIDTTGTAGGTGVRRLTISDDRNNNGWWVTITWDVVNSGSTHYNGFYIHANANNGYGVATMDGDLVCNSYATISSTSTEINMDIAFCRAVDVVLNQNGGGQSLMVSGYLGYKDPHRVDVPTRTGYRFDGYCTVRNATNPVYYIDSSGNWTRTFDINQATTLYAHWTPITDYFTVKLDKQNGTGGSDSVKATAGASLKSITPPTRAGYTFQGYYTNTEGYGTKYYNADGTPFSSMKWPADNLPSTLYAYWTANKYQIKFVRGINNGTEYAIATYGEPLPSIVLPTRSGYTFNGYWTGEYGSGTQYYSATGARLVPAYTLTERLTLYADWKWIVVDPPWRGSGTEFSPYEIYTPYDLLVLANNTNAGVDYSGTYFRQMADLDLSEYTWEPIGSITINGAVEFTGIYDGQNKKIENISTASNGGRGLFGIISNSTIKNVQLVSGTIESGVSNVGGIAAFAVDSVISNCVSCVDVTGLYQVGGIVGLAVNVRLEYCRNFGVVHATYLSSSPPSTTTEEYCAGGIVGYAEDVTIFMCSNRGRVRGFVAGGIVGYLNGTQGAQYPSMLQNCTQDSAVDAIGAYSYGGSLIGVAYYGSSIDCASFGSVNSSLSSSAAIIGAVKSSNVKMIACSFVGEMNSKQTKYFYGTGTRPGTITACYVSATNTSAGSTTSTIIKQYTTYSDWSEYYGLAGTMHDGLPMQKGLYHIPGPSQATHQNIMNALQGFTAMDPSKI